MRSFLKFLAFFALGALIGALSYAGPIVGPSGVPGLEQAHLGLAGFLSGGLITTLATVIEVIFRVIPTKKPLSWLWIGVAALAVVVKICDQLKAVLTDLITIANRTLPPAPAPEAPSAPPQA